MLTPVVSDQGKEGVDVHLRDDDLWTSLLLYPHLHRKVAIERIPFPRRERKLPLILSRDEVKALLEAPSNLRDRAMLAILYGSGLRVSEVIRIKVADIDSGRNVLWVRFGKVVSFRQGCVRPLESGFLFGEEAADGGSADVERACDLGFADALAV